jgi:hypothetical protein
MKVFYKIVTINDPQFFQIMHILIQIVIFSKHNGQWIYLLFFIVFL